MAKGGLCAYERTAPGASIIAGSWPTASSRGVSA